MLEIKRHCLVDTEWLYTSPMKIALLKYLAACWLLLAVTGMARAGNLNFNGGVVSQCSVAGSRYTCTTLDMVYNDTMTIASGYTVTVPGNIAFDYNQTLVMSGTAALIVNGDLDIGNINTPNLKISGGSLSAQGGTFKMGAQIQTIVANISAAAVTIGTGSTTRITGSVTSTGTVFIAANATVNGPISGSTVKTGTPAVINGDVTASTLFFLGSGGRMTGDVVAGRIELQTSEATINGSVKVNTIFLDWHGRVTGKITCNAYTPSDPCSCVTNGSGYPVDTTNGPSCAAPQATAPHHFQITHGGAALTCAPQTVTVTACANADCSSSYTSGATVVMSPGGTSVQAGSSGTVAATVRQTAAGAANLSLSAVPAGANALVCKNTANNTSNGGSACAMTFADSGLIVTVPTQLSESVADVTISAVQASGDRQACVPLFAGLAKTVKLACSYDNPASGTLPVRISATSGSAYVPLASSATSACSSAGTDVSLTFGSDGIARPTMLYADAGRVNLKATYASTSGADNGLVMSGNASAVVVPAKFNFDPVATPARAGASIAAKVTAQNSVGAATPNFGNENPVEPVALGFAQLKPVFAGRSAGTLSGTLDFKAKSGVASASALSWSEVGQITLSAQMASGSYLGATGPLGASNALTFIAHHFDTALYPINNFPASCTPAMGCASGYFAYSRQQFGLQVTARALGGTATKNFDGRDSELVQPVLLLPLDGPGALVTRPPATPAGSVLTNGVAGSSTSLNQFEPSMFTDGVASQTVAYAFPGAYSASGASSAALAAPTNVLFRAQQKNPAGAVIVTSVNDAGTTLEGGLKVYTGRLMVPNSYGSELLVNRLQVQVQYWTGQQWAVNTGDSVTTFLRSQVLLANCQKNLAAGGACKAVVAASAAPAAYAMTSGVTPPAGRLSLAAPGAGNNGSVDVSVGGLPHLPSMVGRVVFGIFKSGPVLYIREVY